MAEDDWLPRFVEPAVREALNDTPVVVIQGARQVGKSTLANRVSDSFAGARRVTLDDATALAVARADPSFFVGQAPDSLLVIDEAQRAPQLILPIKASVDRDRRPGRFLLTCSADLLRVRGVGDSLARRAETIELRALSQGEIARRDSPDDFVSWLSGGGDIAAGSVLSPQTVVAGGYPEAVRRRPERARRWLESYAAQLATHDARELQQGAYADHLPRLLTLLAAGGQQELVQAKTARALDVSEQAVKAYVALAEAMRLVTELPSWGRTPRGRVVRRPKIALTDTGLSAALTGFTAEHAVTIGGREHYGALVEQFVSLELRKQQGWSAQRFSLWHYRELDGLEVDIVVELSDGRLVAIEIKSATEVSEKAWRGLMRFRDRFRDRDVTGVVFHGGHRAATIDGWLRVLPITTLWEH